MSDLAEPVASPCVSICALDEQNLCIGCYRTAEEISLWSRMTNEEKRQVMRQVARRERESVNFFNPLPSSE